MTDPHAVAAIDLHQLAVEATRSRGLLPAFTPLVSFAVGANFERA